MRRRSLTLAFAILVKAVCSQLPAFECARTVARLSYGPSWAVALSGEVAVVGAGDAVIVVDVALPEQPRRLAELRLDDEVVSAAWMGDRLVVVTIGSINVLDLSDPASPEREATMEAPDDPGSVVVTGTTAWLVGRMWPPPWDGYGLFAVDVSDPADPVALGQVLLQGSARSVAVVGDTAYVASEHAGLHVIDVSDPTAMTLLGSYSLEYPSAVASDGQTAYVTTWSQGLFVLDVSDPANMMLRSHVVVGLTGVPHALALDGSTLYLGVAVCDPRECPQDNEVMALDVSDPQQVVTLSSVELPGGAWDLELDGGRLAVVNPLRGLSVIDAADPSALAELGRLDPGLDEVSAVAIDGTHVLLGDRGLRVVGLEDARHATIDGELDMDSWVRAIAVADSVVALLDDDAELHLVDIGSPEEPVELASFSVSADAHDLSLTGGLLLVADAGAGLQVVDVSAPNAPVELARVPLPGDATAVVTAGELAFAGFVIGTFADPDASGGLVVVDLADPGSPQVLSSLSTLEQVVDLGLSGDHAVLLGTATVTAVDASDPAAPVVVGSAECSPRSRLAVGGEVAYLSSRPGSLQIVQLADPTRPVVLASLVWQPFTIADGGPQGGHGVAFDGGLALVADGEYGLRVIDPSACLSAALPPWHRVER